MAEPLKPMASRDADLDWFAMGGLMAIAGACHLFFDWQTGGIASLSPLWAAVLGVGLSATISERVQRICQIVWLAGIGIVASLALLLLLAVGYLIFFWDPPSKTVPKQPVQSAPIAPRR